jgi:serine/threonine protein kinase
LITGTEIEMQPKTRLQESTKYQISFHDIEVERQLGGGSYGKVYLGRWNNAPVALKFCKKQTQINEFLKEAQLMMYVIKRVSNQFQFNLFLKPNLFHFSIYDRDLPPHPNIVQMYGVSIDGPQPVIVMEYCSGGSIHISH